MLAVALLLSLPTAASHAGGLYRWMTPDGRVEIGPTPPPGVNATPWIPGQPENPAGAASPAAPAAAAPAQVPPAARATRPSGPALPKPKDAAPAQGGSDCAKLGTASSNLSRQVAAKEREIRQLEAKLEKLEATEVAFSRTDCARNDSYGRTTGCRSGTFDRDAEISKGQVALDRAQEKLDELEERARRSGVPANCP